MWQVFNNGIGMVMIVGEEYVTEIVQRLTALGESAYIMGEIVHRKNGDVPIIYV